MTLTILVYNSKPSPEIPSQNKKKQVMMHRGIREEYQGNISECCFLGKSLEKQMSNLTYRRKGKEGYHRYPILYNNHASCPPARYP